MLEPGHEGKLAETKVEVSPGIVTLRKDSLQQDLRQALRQLRRAPGFALTVVLTLAIGIGANLAVFRLLHAVLFAQLPIDQPSQLYSLRAVKSLSTDNGFTPTLRIDACDRQLRRP